ncbi:hypothetical protein [Sphingosinicella sp. CPCC 101087]|uniref:hypothetical protein n=1 Tax=Sphingosinicella sp. CPCC 101087 TaxID=2497754 RepID=UPI00101CB672|nr:hypothetical protein [Sphingosinicella sp. CPCC 101087]
MGHEEAIAILFVAVAIGGPLTFGLAGLFGRGAAAAPPRRWPWDWQVSLRSSLLYALTFNIVFFIQELFLVVPKALAPGIHPVLYHNNHAWEGDHPLASLFQGTGAVATLLTGLLFAVLARAGAGQSSNTRLFIVWMAYHGLFMALTQVVIGAILPANDVGMAMDYLQMSPAAKAAAALVALVAMIAAGLALTRPLLALADDAGRIAAPGARSGFMLRIATLPALAAILLIVPFRMPREAIEVVLPPLIVTVAGIGWIQANAWRTAGIAAGARSLAGSLVGPLVSLMILLLVFQFVLRPGIAF